MVQWSCNSTKPWFWSGPQKQARLLWHSSLSEILDVVVFAGPIPALAREGWAGWRQEQGRINSSFRIGLRTVTPSFANAALS